jgi:hypothetical protein
MQVLSAVLRKVGPCGMYLRVPSCAGTPSARGVGLCQRCPFVKK